jgi:hypothetical protein
MRTPETFHHQLALQRRALGDTLQYYALHLFVTDYFAKQLMTETGILADPLREQADRGWSGK